MLGNQNRQTFAIRIPRLKDRLFYTWKSKPADIRNSDTAVERQAFFNTWKTNRQIFAIRIPRLKDRLFSYLEIKTGGYSQFGCRGWKTAFFILGNQNWRIFAIRMPRLPPSFLFPCVNLQLNSPAIMKAGSPNRQTLKSKINRFKQTVTQAITSFLHRSISGKYFTTGNATVRPNVPIKGNEEAEIRLVPLMKIPPKTSVLCSFYSVWHSNTAIESFKGRPKIITRYIGNQPEQNAVSKRPKADSSAPLQINRIALTPFSG